MGKTFKDKQKRLGVDRVSKDEIKRMKRLVKEDRKIRNELRYYTSSNDA
jgi:hypothetical protein